MANLKRAHPSAEFLCEELNERRTLRVLKAKNRRLHRGFNATFWIIQTIWELSALMPFRVRG
jgi:hypothetical protein